MDVASRLRELEEEAERLRQQLKQQEAEPAQEPPKGKKRKDLEATEGATRPEPPEAAPADIPPTPKAQEEAENLIRRAKVAKMRGQTRECMDLLVQAEKVAPSFPPVLEALGDELAAKSRWKDAQAVYGRAAHLEPGNVGIERKFAQSVLHASVPIEALLMGGTSSASLIEEAANARTAAVWSFFLPGVGQIVLGETGKGIGFLVGWLAAWTVTLLIPNGLKGIVGMAGASGRAQPPNMIVLLPLFIAIVLWLSAIYDASSHSKAVVKPKVDRPVPPVNLPFE